MRDYISIGSTPCDEACAQVGQPDYRRRALAECHRFIALLRKTFGPEPEGAELRVKAFPHDFGTYYEVVCHYDTDIPASVDYALHCEAQMPVTWGEETAEQAEKTCPQCGHTLKVLLFLSITPDGYVCETCQLYWSEDLQPLAHVIA